MWKQRHSKRELTWISIYLRNARKMFHFISQSLLMAHLLGRDPHTSWRKDSRHRTTTLTGEEHLTPLLAPLQLRGFAWPSSSSHIHRQNHSGLAGSNRSRATSGLRQVTNRLPWPVSPALSQSQGKGAALGDSAASALCMSACSPWIPREPSGNFIKITRETALTEN